MFFFVLVLLGWGGGASPETDLQKMHGGVAQKKKELGGIKKKIQEEKQRVKEIGRKESSVISQLNILDQSLVKKEKELKALKQKLVAVSRKAQKAQEDYRALTQTISAQEVLLEERMVALYKFGDAGMPQVLFSSQSYEDFSISRRYLASILSQDRQLIEDYRKRQVLVVNHREQLKEDEGELQKVKKQSEQKKAEIQKDRTRKSLLLDSVRDEKRIHLAAIRELESAATQLQALINRLEKAIRSRPREEIFVPTGKGFAAQRGKLMFPVAGKILSTFGRNENPKFNTFTVQKGIEIEASEGSEVLAVHEGRVLFADWFKGYGKILIIDHGDGYYTLSGHASAVLRKVGEEVRAGDLIALVGDTGSLKGSCLYFEIRQKGKPLDPLEWLAAPKAR